MNDLKQKALDLHRGGKIAISSRVSLESKDDLSLAYTPGVAFPCLEISNNKDNAYLYTSKKDTVAVITDGSAVLGLGNIGPLASMPVMEGKCLLFKRFANINAIPITIDSNDVDEIVKCISLIAPSFGGINLEDISFPRCIEVEERLNEILDIPVFHDDQKGTAIVVAAALINACKLVKKDLSALKIAICGLGAAGSSIAKLLKKIGVKTIYGYNKDGVISNKKELDPALEKLINQKILDNFDYKFDTVEEIMENTDVFIGVSVGNIITKEMIKKMNDLPIVFALANPSPEISYNDAKQSKAYIFATGRSDYPNQINNVLAFPGIFKGILSSPYKKITEKMCIDAAYAIASLIDVDELTPEYIIPSVFNEDVVVAVSNAIINSEV